MFNFAFFHPQGYFKISVLCSFFRYLKNAIVQFLDMKEIKSLKRSYAFFDAFCLPAPTFGREVLENLSKNRHLVNPLFFSAMEQYITSLKSNLEAKRSVIDGESITGEGKKSSLFLLVLLISLISNCG